MRLHRFRTIGGGQGRNRLLVGVGFAAVAALFTGCGGADADDMSASAQPDGSGFPVTIEHEFGTTTIEKKPERIVTLGEDLDTLAALGITPVGYAPTAPGYTDDVPYLEDRIDLSDSEILDGAEMGEFNVEQIAALEPDLILGTNLNTMDTLYDQLSDLAPTLGYEKAWGETSWQEMATTIGRAVGDEDGAAAAVAETDRYLANLRDRLPGLAGKTVASAYYYSAGTFASNPHSASMDKYKALGMKVSSPLLDTLAGGGASNSISMEQIDILDADLLTISFGDADLRAQLEADPLYRGLDVVKRDHVDEVDTEDMLPSFANNNPTLLNIPWLLDQQEDDLTAVAQER